MHTHKLLELISIFSKVAKTQWCIKFLYSNLREMQETQELQIQSPWVGERSPWRRNDKAHTSFSEYMENPLEEEPGEL